MFENDRSACVEPSTKTTTVARVGLPTVIVSVHNSFPLSLVCHLLQVSRHQQMHLL